jgi:membrane protease YdiL (CAAX protease family)
MFSAELPVWWTGILAGFAAGIGEELLMRFLLMTLLTLLLSKLIRLPRDIAVWSSIVIVALVFGLLHLPATMEVVDLSTLVVFRALLLNGIGGIVFGWLYWKKGLEYAMLTHFCANVVLHGIIPLIV